MQRRARHFESTFPDLGGVIQTSRDRLRADAACEECEGLTVHRTRFSAGFQYRAGVPPGRVLLALSDGDGEPIAHGRPWPAATFALLGSAGIDFFSLAPASIVAIEFDRVRARLSGQLRAALSSGGPEFVSCDEDAAAELRRCLQDPARGLPLALDRVLASSRRSPQRPAVARRYQLVLDAEEFMREHAGEGPLLDTLGAELGCSARTLIYAFTQSFGLGPMAYFKVQRLNAVHRTLSRGQDPRKISELAPQFGFRHMGHFSTDYRLMFGRPPSRSREGRSRGVESA